jgi:acetoacetate decarboxylase
MKLTNEIFDRYMKAGDKEIIAMSDELGFECAADFEEDIMIWAIYHGDKTKVMKLYQMDESEYADAREMWADEMERGTK